jgi:hypothetical protein
MKFRILTFTILTTSCFLAPAQTPEPSQSPTPAARSGQSQPQREGRGRWSGGGMMGRGVMGTVTAVAPDHFTVKTDAGEIYTVHYSVNTRMMKGGGPRRNSSDTEPQFTPPETIKATDIKVGDAIAVSGEIDATAKSLGAVVIFQIDPERAKQMREMQANYGKTWLMGRVTAINEAKVTLQGGPDNATHTLMADENTTFRKHRDPITLADVLVGDMIRAEGSIKNGEFLATTVAVISPPADRSGDPAPPQK